MSLKDLKESIFGKSQAANSEEYIELDLTQDQKKNKVQVRYFIVRQFDDIVEVLNSLREGYTIAVVDIGPLKKQKDMIELKRAIAKIKKTTEALDGDIKGFGESIIIITPSFAEIYRPMKKPEQKKKTDFIRD